MIKLAGGRMDNSIKIKLDEMRSQMREYEDRLEDLRRSL